MGVQKKNGMEVASVWPWEQQGKDKNKVRWRGKGQVGLLCIIEKAIDIFPLMLPDC